jgi:hypothetical protein
MDDELWGSVAHSFLDTHSNITGIECSSPKSTHALCPTSCMMWGVYVYHRIDLDVYGR